MSTNPFDRQAPIEGIKHIIVVGSGKGGVGKSSVAANLAISLKNTGKKVGLLDADIHGPSIPRLFGAINQPPAVNEARKIEPVVRYGIKLMSMGFLVDDNSALIWRGPMLFKAMDQFFRDVLWGDLDYLIIDLPPGTGDVPLTIAQKVPIAGAVIVCTPQNIALIDARKAIDMFERVSVPIFGVVENMAYLENAESKERTQLFPKGDLRAYLDAKKIPSLGEIPFDPAIGLACEAGIPFAMTDTDSTATRAFNALASKIISETIP